MVVDIDILGKNGNSRAGRVRSRVIPVNPSGDARQMHERLVEYRRLTSQYKADFEAAMASLASANADIDRLNGEVSRLSGEVARLEGELQRERGKNPPKKGRKPQKDKEQEPAQEVVQEATPNPVA